MPQRLWFTVFGLSCGIVASVATSAAPSKTSAAPPKSESAGTGTLYLASYAKRVAIVDEATEKPAGEIPLKNGLAWTMRLSVDRSRFYVLSADTEKFEIVDIAARQSVDTFTLNEAPNKHVRTMAYDIDPANRRLIAVARTTTKLVDRFEIGAPMFVAYDLKDHRVVKTAPWTHEDEPRQYQVKLRFSPDGRLLYVFADQILVYDAATLEQVDSWDLSLPRDAGRGRFRLRSTDETADEPGFFSALFTVDDPVQHRRLLGVGRVDLGGRNVEFFPIGPAPDRGELTFALAPDRRRAYVLHEEIRRYALWTIDMAAKRVQSRIEFDGRPRMALRCSSNGKILYVFEAGHTIDLYQADGFKYLRTIALDADMMYDTFHVVGPRPSGARPATNP